MAEIVRLLRVVTCACWLAACGYPPLARITHLLPAGERVPSAAENPELSNQINLNDGIDSKALVASGGIIPAGTGSSAGTVVRYWSFGSSTQAPSPLYKFFVRNEAGELTPIDHPPLVDALPGDAGYSGVHSITKVVITPTYEGQLITSVDALADALDLGIIEEPMPTGTFVASPIVPARTLLDVGGTTPVISETVYGRGYTVGAFEFGGMLGVQPGNAPLPTNQVSFLREDHEVAFDVARPIFQAVIPTTPPTATANYTPLSVVVNVDLEPGVVAASITQDADLFVRSSSGDLMFTSPHVARFEITSSILLLPLQFQTGRL